MVFSEFHGTVKIGGNPCEIWQKPISDWGFISFSAKAGKTTFSGLRDFRGKSNIPKNILMKSGIIFYAAFFDFIREFFEGFFMNSNQNKITIQFNEQISVSRKS